MSLRGKRGIDIYNFNKKRKKEWEKKIAREKIIDKEQMTYLRDDNVLFIYSESKNSRNSL